jgi:hypothetical protein
MAEIFLNLATAFGLSASAGLNAYIPLLVIALVDRLTDGLIDLQGPWVWLSNWWVIGVLAFLLLVEILADKIPAVDTINDVIQTVVRPAAGAILFAATTRAIQLHPVIAAICGVIIAGGVHAVKATGRPAITATTAGVANPVISVVEDVTSTIVSVISVVAPYLILGLFIFLASILALVMLRRKRRRSL